MNAGVSLVQAYLALNGYLTVAEFPVIGGRRGGGYQELTDLDVLGVRFPHAGHVVPRGSPGPEDDLHLDADPDLAPAEGAVDVVIGEVKEGRARLNEAARRPAVLQIALQRVGCVQPGEMDGVVGQLRRDGEARGGGADGTIPFRVRLVAFGDGDSGQRDGYTVVSLRRVARFVNEHLERYHDILQPADLTDPVLGLLHLLRKLS